MGHSTETYTFPNVFADYFIITWMIVRKERFDKSFMNSVFFFFF